MYSDLLPQVRGTLVVGENLSPALCDFQWCPSSGSLGWHEAEKKCLFC